jgi:hypothetical protein
MWFDLEEGTSMEKPGARMTRDNDQHQMSQPCWTCVRLQAMLYMWGFQMFDG